MQKEELMESTPNAYVIPVPAPHLEILRNILIEFLRNLGVELSAINHVRSFKQYGH